MKTFAILGHPVSHSLSPHLHNAVFQELSLQDHEYVFCDTPPEDLERVMGELREGHWAGFSVTIPHKQTVVAYCDELTGRAQKVGAVNTLLRVQGEDGAWKIVGDNTDYLGFAKSLEEADVPSGKALVLGSGGAAQAVIAVLDDLGFQITVASRNADRQIEACEVLAYEDLDPSLDWKLIVNTTPLGMHPDVDSSALEDPAWFEPGRTVLDIVYNPRMTKLLQLAKQGGAQVVTGDRMFLWQAVEQAKLFTGSDEVPVEVMERSI